MPRKWGLVLVLMTPLAAQSLDPPALPAAAKTIAVEPGAGIQLKYHFLAVGKQIYKCQAGAWSKSSTPDATLFDQTEKELVKHGAGPSWTTIDGGSTIKANGATAVHFAAPDGVSIDWLKLDVDKPSRTGVFRDITTIQRLYTGGGKAPAAACSADAMFEAPYTAQYYFWGSE
jgi:hypothetical protein